MIILLFIIGNAMRTEVAGAGEYEPWNFNPPIADDVPAPAKNLSPAGYLMYQGVTFFSRYISPVDGDRCSMYPTCSSYSRQAVAKHGFIIGFIMTADRLIHENNETDTAMDREIGGTIRYDDPVENNDFWWYKHP
jgi:uncharacterized protein